MGSARNYLFKFNKNTKWRWGVVLGRGSNLSPEKFKNWKITTKRWPKFSRYYKNLRASTVGRFFKKYSCWTKIARLCILYQNFSAPRKYNIIFYYHTLYQRVKRTRWCSDTCDLSKLIQIAIKRCKVSF